MQTERREKNWNQYRTDEVSINLVELPNYYDYRILLANISIRLWNAVVALVGNQCRRDILCQSSPASKVDLTSLNYVFVNSDNAVTLKSGRGWYQMHHEYFLPSLEVVTPCCSEYGKHKKYLMAKGNYLDWSLLDYTCEALVVFSKAKMWKQSHKEQISSKRSGVSWKQQFSFG